MPAEQERRHNPRVPHIQHARILAADRRDSSSLIAQILRAGQGRQASRGTEGSESAGSPQLAGYFFSLAGGLSN
jgi:hypothetical protein